MSRSSDRAQSFRLAGERRIAQNVELLYNMPEIGESLRCIMDIRLIGYDWVRKFSHRNNSQVEVTHELETSVGLSTVHEHESTQRWGIEAAFRGISVGFENTTRTLTSVETSHTRTTRTRIVVPPGQAVFMYQRVFYFETELFFLYGQQWRPALWTVGVQGGGHIVTGDMGRLFRTSRTSIETEERRSEDTPLHGQRMGTNTVFPNPILFPHAHQVRAMPWERLSHRARTTLRQRGISQYNPVSPGWPSFAPLCMSDEDVHLWEEFETEQETEKETEQEAEQGAEQEMEQEISGQEKDESTEN
ncbi:hypothetical protein DFH27DRAFT_582412 [Peziza echinospora]|nr:hypothetical protein DFH27DRAFT_582412 [Peziza echinospora]